MDKNVVINALVRIRSIVDENQMSCVADDEQMTLAVHGTLIQAPAIDAGSAAVFAEIVSASIFDGSISGSSGIIGFVP